MVTLNIVPTSRLVCFHRAIPNPGGSGRGEGCCASVSHWHNKYMLGPVRAYRLGTRVLFLPKIPPCVFRGEALLAGKANSLRWVADPASRRPGTVSGVTVGGEMGDVLRLPTLGPAAGPDGLHSTFPVLAGRRGDRTGVALQLVGVRLQVVVLTFAALEPDVLLGGHPEDVPAVGRLLVRLADAEDRGPRPWGRGGLRQRHDGPAVHEAGAPGPRHVGYGGGDVVVADEAGLHLAAADARSAHDEGEVYVFLVGLVLAVGQAVLAEVRAVVRVEDEVCLVHLAAPAEDVRGVGDEPVHPLQGAQGLPVLGVEVRDLALGEPVPAPDIRALVGHVGLVEGRGARDADPPELLLVHRGRRVRLVPGGGVDEPEDRGRGAEALLQEGCGVVRDEAVGVLAVQFPDVPLVVYGGPALVHAFQAYQRSQPGGITLS